MTPSKRRHKYDEAFKRKAVQQLMRSGKPVTAISASLGIEQSVLHRWKSRYACKVAAAAPPSPESEIASLKQELDTVKRTVEQLRSVVRKSLEARYLGAGATEGAIFQKDEERSFPA